MYEEHLCQQQQQIKMGIIVWGTPMSTTTIKIGIIVWGTPMSTTTNNKEKHDKTKTNDNSVKF